MVMKKILLLLSMACLHHVQAQTIFYVVPGTTLTVGPGTSLSMDLLTLTPSSSFSLNDISVTRGTTITHPSVNTYVSRVYTFSSTTGSFSGDIQMDYQDAELNGLPEASLQLNIYNGTAWQAYPATTNNTVSNYVLTSSLSNVTLNELTLAAAAAPLPLYWGKTRAYRQNNQVWIEWETLQESNVRHFDVEKSTDGGDWASIVRGIPARNLDLPQLYRQADPVYSPEKVFYRIREVDLDDRSGYSAVLVVSAENSKNPFVLFPNPMADRFYISGEDVSKLRQVQLFSSGGVLLKTWDGAQDSYRADLPATGVYYVRLTRMDGSIQYETIVKR